MLVAVQRRCPHCGSLHFTRTLGLPVYRLPATCPGNASWSFERIVATWRDGVGRVGAANESKLNVLN
jgi:hypothetical protein